MQQNPVQNSTIISAYNSVKQQQIEVNSAARIDQKWHKLGQEGTISNNNQQEQNQTATAPLDLSWKSKIKTKLASGSYPRSFPYLVLLWAIVDFKSSSLID